MTGYREHSFDPYAYEQAGAPLRPFNWVQWAGVALEVIGLGLFLVHVAGMIGWLAPVEPARLGFVPMILGVILINSRRAPGTPAGSEQLAKNRRLLIITVAICAAILGAALVIQFTGA